MVYVSLAEPIPDRLKRAVLAIGNFDGVHRGHHVLIEVARKRAIDLGHPFACLSFDPHPRRVFQPDAPPFLLTPGPVKRDRLLACLADHVITIPFSNSFASLSADDFMQDILRQRLEVAHIVVGHDFHFGHKRLGSVATLRERGFLLTVVDAVRDGNGDPYTSTRIRERITHGDLPCANQLLGWEWYVQGTVVRGDQRGRTLGYPTANVHPGETLSPSYGVYAARVQIIDEGPQAPWRDAVANIGIRPMFEARTPLVEAHLFDWSGDLYERVVRIQPVQKLRDEKKFDSVTALIEAMNADSSRARLILQGENSETHLLP